METAELKAGDSTKVTCYQLQHVMQQLIRESTIMTGLDPAVMNSELCSFEASSYITSFPGLPPRLYLAAVVFSTAAR